MLMKSFFRILLLVCVTSTVAFSQVDPAPQGGHLELFVGGGTALPYLPSPSSTFWAPGINVAAGFGYRTVPGPLGYGTIFGTVEYSHFFFDRDGLFHERNINPAGVVVSGDPSYAITVMAMFKGTFAKDVDAIGPYFLMGLGGMHVVSGEIVTSGTDRRSRPKDTKTGIAWQLGVGVDFPVNERTLAFVECKYYMAFTSSPGRQYFPMSAGLRFIL
jgi:hypothetical protein